MKIYLDPFGLRAPSEALEVVDDSSYVAARRLLLAFFRNPASPSRDVVVRQEPWTLWFEDLPKTLAVSISPLALLREKHQTATLPGNLTDKDVQELNLLSDPSIEPTVAGITKHFFSDLFKSPATVEPATVYRLAKFVAQKPISLTKRFLRQLWSQHLEHFPIALEPLKAADVQFAKAIAEGIYLGGRREFSSDWEHEYTVWLKKSFHIQINDLQQLKLLSWSSRPFKITDADSKLEAKVAQLVSNELKKGTPPLETLTGRYIGELRAFLSADIKVDAELLQTIENRFSDILSMNPQLHEQIRSRITPELTSPPDAADLSELPLLQQLRTWQDWAIKSFIPFKFWLDQVKHPSSELLEIVEQHANQYGDWLFANYSSLIDDERILTNTNVRQRVLDLLAPTDSRLIWLIIDGFPDAYTPLLLAALKKHGLNRIKVEYSLTSLPTITQIGIPALLNGMRPDADSFIPNNRKEALVQAYPDYNVVFSNQVRDFAGTLNSESDLCCLHWRELDSYQHKEDREIEGTRAEYIGHELDKRIGLLAAAMSQTPDRRTRLLISTDHGATRCLRNESGISNKKIKEAAVEPHERCIKLVGKLKDEQLDPLETYQLTKELTHNLDDWVAARGYRYFGSNDSGYRHGGLSPEETIVPVLIAEVSDLIVNELTVKYFGTKELELGKTFKDVQIRINNPNGFTVVLQALSIVEDSKAQFILPITIEPNGNVTLKSSLKLPLSLRPQGGYINVTAFIDYVVQGELYTNQTIFTLPIQQANELDDFDFDSL